MESSEDLTSNTNVMGRLDELSQIIEKYGFAWMEDAALHDLFGNYPEDRKTTLFLAALDHILENHFTNHNIHKAMLWVGKEPKEDGTPVPKVYHYRLRPESHWKQEITFTQCWKGESEVWIYPFLHRDAVKRLETTRKPQLVLVDEDWLEEKTVVKLHFNDSGIIFLDGYTPFGVRDGYAVSHAFRSESYYPAYYSEEKFTVIHQAFKDVILKLQNKYTGKRLLFGYSQ